MQLIKFIIWQTHLTINKFDTPSRGIFVLYLDLDLNPKWIRPKTKLEFKILAWCMVEHREMYVCTLIATLTKYDDVHPHILRIYDHILCFIWNCINKRILNWSRSLYFLDHSLKQRERGRNNVLEEKIIKLLLS